MKRAMISSATLLALVVSAETSMAGPLLDQSHRGFAQDVRSSVSQARGHAGTKAKTHQTNNLTDSGAHLTTKYDLGQKDRPLTQQNSTYGSSGGSQLPYVVIIPGHDGDDFTVIFGKESGPDLTDQPVIWNVRCQGFGDRWPPEPREYLANLFGSIIRRFAVCMKARFDEASKSAPNPISYVSRCFDHVSSRLLNKLASKRFRTGRAVVCISFFPCNNSGKISVSSS
jgi:hypothetical protein